MFCGSAYVYSPFHVERKHDGNKHETLLLLSPPSAFALIALTLTPCLSVINNIP